MMWRMNTANNPISIIRITKELPMKYAALLNMEPSSSGLKIGKSLKMQEFKPT
jgi:hypothetical protein